MPTYPDRRSRFAGRAQWDVEAGTPKADNATKTEAKTTLARRTQDTYEQGKDGKFVLVPGNRDPHKDFRKTTSTTAPPESLETPSQSPQNPLYANIGSLKTPQHGLNEPSQNSSPLLTESSKTQLNVLAHDDGLTR